MGYERLNLTDGVDKWKAEHIAHLESGILANEEAIKALVGTVDNSEMEEKLREYAAMFRNTDEAESFLFFTDPHSILGNDLSTIEAEMEKYFVPLKHYYERTPTSFVMCGGDWIGNSDTMDQACFKLGYLDAYMRKNFINYRPILGNHDLNYQGVDDEGTANAGTLTNATIRNLMFREEGKLYYSFKGQNSTVYVLDSGSDWESAMNDYRWEQIDWFAKQIAADNPKHGIIAIHIGFINSALDLSAFAGLITNVAAAYNNRTAIALNGNTYIFTAATGHVEFMICGHVHKDLFAEKNGIPVVGTTHLRDGVVASFDLVLADYDNRKINLVRVGTGENRTVELANWTVETTYTNLVPTAIDRFEDAIYNGIGYKNDTSATTTDESGEITVTGQVTTGLIPYPTLGDVSNLPILYVKGNVDILYEGLETAYDRMQFFTADKEYVHEVRAKSFGEIYFTKTVLGENYFSLTPVIHSNGVKTKIANDGYWNATVKYIRLTFTGTGEGLIITVNEPING